MKIKSLELVGFKSFSEKTTIHFSDGVTAIVGPNGSGKSNIVDAIRWLVGESAPTMIRTKLLEDVIFSGSDGAPPMGMAEVNLVFDNCDGSPPVGYENFSEIQITRRAYKDGESEFFINKTPCRLKDIVELSLDAGSGARGYCIIEQAKVQQIITGKPEETRMLIEEAAGVAKYRMRKKEAQRKLETTRQNLLRLADILLEVKKQLSSIDRQARKAARYKKLKEELQQVEIEVLRRKAIKESEEERLYTARLDEMVQKVKRCEETLQTLRIKEQQLRNEIFSRETEIDAVRQQLGSTNEAFYRLDTEHGGVTKEMLAIEERISALLDEGRKGERELVEMKERIAELGESMSETDIELAHFHSEPDAEAGARDEIGKRVHELKEIQETKREALVDMMSRLGGLDNSISINEKWFSETERKRNHLARELDLIQADISRAEKELKDEIAREKELMESIYRFTEEFQRVTTGISQCEREREGLNAIIEQSRKEKERAGSRLVALREILESYELFGESVSYIMNEFRSLSDGSEILGVLGELIGVEKGYEKAVEAALGESLKYIVVRDSDDGVVALRALKDTGKGRGSFAPVKLRKRGERSLEVPTGEGVISKISGIISAPGECRDLIENLLGDVLLVNSVEDAVRLWKTNGHWATYVTLEGDLVLPSGIISGGSSKGEESGILSKRSEMAELESTLFNMGKEIKIKEGQLNKVVAELEGKRRRHKELSDEIGLREKEKHSASVSIEFLEKELEKQRKRKTWSEEEHSHLVAEMKRFERQNEESKNLHKESSEKVSVLEKEIAALKEEIQRSELGLRELVEKTSKRELQRVEIQEKRSELAAEVNSLNKILEDKSIYREKMIGEIEELKSLKEELSRQKENMITQVKALADERGSLEKVLAEKTESLSRLKYDLAEANKESAGLLSSMENTKEDMATLRERLAAVKTRSENINAVARDSYGLGDIAMYPEEERLAGVEEAALGEEIDVMRGRLESLGEVNVSAIEEREDLAKRYEDLLNQKEDLEKSMGDLEKVISKIDRESRDRFVAMFGSVNEKFMELFPKLFSGGKGYLKLTDENNLLESGVEIIPQPPGKRLKNLSLLSNGEKALTGICLLLSLFFVRPGPFLFLDEVDAPLDEANVDRFNRLIRDISHNCQVIMITHKKRTMELADFLYGTTMDRPGISRIVSAQLS